MRNQIKEDIRERVLETAHLEWGKGKEKSGGRKSWNVKWAAAIPVALFLAFAITVNTSSAFAQAMSDVPILRGIAQVITFREYADNSTSSKIHVRIPKIASTGNTELEERTNAMIAEEMERLAEQEKQQAENQLKEYASIDNERDFKKNIIDLDYEVKAVSENTLSFVIHLKEDAVVPYETQYIYNLNLKTGKNITLSELLGENYKVIVDGEIDRQVRERSKKDPNLLSYYERFYMAPEDGDMEGGQGIEADQEFYINEAGNPVIVFDPYYIAPEYAGSQEFEIPVK